jgi:hypothetical protein
MVTALPASMLEALWPLRLEHLWIGLVLIGMCSVRSWWVVALLSLMGFVQVAAFYALPGWSYDLAAPFIEFGVALVIARWGVSDSWVTVIVWLFLASLTLQALAAFLTAFGADINRLLYLTLNAIYTAQLASAARPGGQRLGNALHCFSAGRSRGPDADQFSVKA